MRNKKNRHLRHALEAGWRDTLVLFREFQQPLLLFVIAIAGCGLIYYYLAIAAGEPLSGTIEAIYLVLALTFLQSNGGFPKIWYLQIFHFLMPILGIGILAQGLADFGVLLFNRRARGKDWEMAVSSTYSNHVVLIGLGHLGFRVVSKLHDIDEEVVVIELNPKAELADNVRKMGTPVIQDDGTRESVLENAGIPKAKAIILCTQNDSLNLHMAVKARNLNPNINVIIRIFDDEFARSLKTQFGFHAFSATGMAAPIFAATAANVDVTPPIEIEGQPNSLARMEINRSSNLDGKSVDQIEDTFQVSIVYLHHAHQSLYHPIGDTRVTGGDTLAFLGPPDQISTLIHENRS
jgi:voltage-gated potassium channel